MSERITPDEAIEEALKIGAQGISLGLAKQLQSERDIARKCADSAESCYQYQTRAYNSAMAHAAKCNLLCVLAAKAKEVVFDDPGDAVRWGEAVNDWNESVGKQS